MTEKHLSGKLHVCGASRFIGETHLPEHLLHIALVYSEYAHAEILSIDSGKAEVVEGFVCCLTSRDIPGENNIAHGNNDLQPLLPDVKVEYYGQPIGVIVAENKLSAEEAARNIQVEYKELEPVLTIEEAVLRGHFYIEPRKIECGNVEKGFADSDYSLSGEFETGAQEHLYLETQRCLAVPDDDGGVTLHSSTQSMSEVQTVAARILGLPTHKVSVDVKRLGGAFGGKEAQATIWASLAALAAFHTQKPVLLCLNRMEDFISTGKRHPFKNKYKIGFNADGKINVYQVELYSNGGAYTDLSIAILERALYHSDHAYYIPNAKFTGYPCRTNLPPNTAFRGFGAPQGIITTEFAIQRVADFLGLDAIEIRKKNCYITGQTTPYGMEVLEPVGREMFDELETLSDYHQLRHEVDTFNKTHKYNKQGIGVIPGKFGISFTAGFLNQGSVLIWIYTDGSISLSHGGIEMGQQVNTKIAQIAANVLGVSINRIRIESANTKRVGNTSPTAASTGSDINGYATLDAATRLKKRLSNQAVKYFLQHDSIVTFPDSVIFRDDKVYSDATKDNSCSFGELVSFAYFNFTDLGAHGYYFTPGITFDHKKGKGKPFYYFVFGASLSVMEIDLLTGEYNLKKVVIVHDASSPLNQEVDSGQIYGAFAQGYGLCTMEELPIDQKGRYLAVTPSTYKIPTISDIPDDFTLKQVTDRRSQASVMGSKAVGEPPLIYGLAPWLAIYDAVRSLNPESNQINLKFPATPEAVLTAVNKLRRNNDSY
ncbi:MAG: molybdopterin-dependent oxidoreductase [Candidatus Cloacimonetes bacterium]|nr:molybdopterin-dependent oxidoreductase [Candidatus Cloacimonadota bacterium]